MTDNPHDAEGRQQDVVDATQEYVIALEAEVQRLKAELAAANAWMPVEELRQVKIERDRLQELVPEQECVAWRSFHEPHIWREFTALKGKGYHYCPGVVLTEAGDASI